MNLKACTASADFFFSCSRVDLVDIILQIDTKRNQSKL